ncbi:bicyclomycin resistance protein [Haematobacter missouriensis]|uniref:Nitrate ABC transporter substrate-binding protein n=1 Tax=Haematobacter missouriensis TaxID=366616 RepID=A0A212AIL8_9RHOB|nr:ABC transporter substrate-binding protein [Haematobacter missouriensis]KFI32710.1 bicyclomycin resistance protein [Haematobacter missouriensis]OWJ79129.1 nitrate ABC transporter substrate-binding protein [Haematobacter missouriensis]OWJ81273.1 nitrate ABC transporter substrate-binding protein [Haematobacter missouriensis]
MTRHFRPVLGALLLSAATPALAGEPFTFMTSWFAQAEHGGFYQALATGLYEKAGLDVTIRMGGPQVNSMQLLLAGEADAYSGFDFQILNGVSQGLPLVAVAAVFQHDMNGLVTHPDVTALDQIGDRTVMMATSARTAWWPWLKAKYDLSDDQVKPYTFNIQPFVADSHAVQQGFASSEPYGLTQLGISYNFLPFYAEGYPPYGGTITTRHDVLEKREDALRRFVRASMEGWKSYLADPAPGNALIRAANPKMTEDQLDFAVSHLREMNTIGMEDAARHGIGTMNPERWKASYDYMVGADLLPATTDWQSAFTTRIIDEINVLPSQ